MDVRSRLIAVGTATPMTGALLNRYNGPAPKMNPMRAVNAVTLAENTSHSDGRADAVAQTSPRRTAAARNVSASAVGGEGRPGAGPAPVANSN